MGAPKQKWTSEEEAALKAGVLKHGAGKWRTILKDPEFSTTLNLRSNVDLKDKWRNLSVMANGWGSREKARLAHRRMRSGLQQDENPSAVMNVGGSDDEMAIDEALAAYGGSPQSGSSKRSMIRLDTLVMEAINNLNEPGGSNKTTIGSYIEDQYWAPPNFKRLLSMKLKYLTVSGKLVKTKRKYRVTSNPELPDKRRIATMSMAEGKQRTPKVDRGDNVVPPKSQINGELLKMRTMTPQEAAAAAALAVAEAEAAMAEAIEAARKAEEAEVDAAAALAFVEAAEKSLKERNTPRMMIRV